MPCLPNLNQISLVTKRLVLVSSLQAMASRICPRCGRNDTRTSVRRGVVDDIMACFGMAPYRCRACRNRFFRLHPCNSEASQAVLDIDAAPVDLDPTPVEAPSVEPVHPLSSVPIAYSLLIVSRDPSIRKLLCKFLARPGYHTHQLADSTLLASELRARKVDLVIADLDEPEQQGLETLAALRSIYPNLQIIALSALRIAKVPGSTVLPKPFRRETLLDSVQSALVTQVELRSPALSAPA